MPKYRIEFQDGNGLHKQAWQKFWKASQANLERWVFGYADSLKLGGVNDHVSKALGYIPYPTKARIVRQSDNAIMAEWKAGMFQVF